MNNLLSLTEFIRDLKERPLGFSALYVVTEGKIYSPTVNGLIATAAREGVKISTSQVIIVDPSSLSSLAAIKVTRK